MQTQTKIPPIFSRDLGYTALDLGYTMRLTTQKVSNRPPSMCGTYIKNLSAELFVGRNIISAEQSFRRKIVRPNNYCRKKKIRPTKFLHANWGPRNGSVRFDVYVFGQTIVRPKICSFGRKIYLVRPKICFSKFWRPDCHESVTHLRDSTHYWNEISNIFIFLHFDWEQFAF